MRIVHTIFMEEYSGNYPFSGAENHLFVLMEAQKKAGLDVVFAPVLHRSGPLLLKKLIELQQLGIEIKKMPTTKWLSIFNIIFLIRLAWQFRKERKSIIHTHLVLAEFYCKLASYSIGCSKQVTSIHNDEPMFKKVQWKLLLRFLDFFTKQYITITNHVRRYMIDVTNISEEKFATIYYGVKYDAIKKSKEKLREELNLPKDKLIIGFVGRLNEQKNIPLLLESAKCFPELFFALFGVGPNQKMIEAFIKKNNITNFRLLGHHPQAAKFIKAFDIFCLPSKWEGLGLVLLEAMNADCPIIGSSAGAIPEILNDGKCGIIFKSESIEELKKAILRLSTDEALRIHFAQEAKQHLHKNFTIEKMTTETTHIYKKVLESKC